MYMQFKIRIVLACLLFLSTTFAEAQSIRYMKNPSYKNMNRHGVFSFSAGVGVSSYFGDLKNSRIDLWVKPSIQLGIQYRVNDHLNIRSEAIWYRISGADSLNDQDTRIYGRNLSFRSDNIELNVVALYELFNKYSRSYRPWLNPYAFAGIGITTVNPEAFYEGEWYKLRPLMTEGEAYSSVAFVVPFGVGVSHQLSKSLDIALELGYRYTFTDYLDDASGAYIGVENIDDPIRRALSDRRPEKGIDPAPAGFKDRGNSSVNDWYMITGLKISYTPTRNYKKPVFR
jgi:hypothetical protein